MIELVNLLPRRRHFRSFIHLYTVMVVVKIMPRENFAEGLENPSFSILFHPISSLFVGFVGMGPL